MPLPAPRLRQAGRCKLSFAKSREARDRWAVFSILVSFDLVRETHD
jgi:hypothetical protein